MQIKYAKLIAYLHIVGGNGEEDKNGKKKEKKKGKNEKKIGNGKKRIKRDSSCRA